jgi:sugar phosphate isomerase/epimerase
LRWFIEARVSPEIGLDENGLAMPRGWHKANAKRLFDAGLDCAAHLPFKSFDMGSPEPAERARARDTLLRAAEVASIYKAVLMVGHPGYVAGRDSAVRADGSPDVALPGPEWLERTALIWKDLPGVSGSPLMLENIYDAAPGVVLSLVERLREGMSVADVGVCFDAGHWHCFSEGAKKRDMPEWVAAFAPYLRHVHLHDNSGGDDEHLGLGAGSVDFTLLLRLLKKHALAPSFTFEPHSAKAFLDNSAWLAGCPEAAEQMGWELPRASELPVPPFS